MNSKRLLLAGCLVAACGCQSSFMRSQSPEEAALASGHPRLVGDLAVPYGIHPVAIEAVAMVAGLPGTGSDPPPSPQRSRLMDEMQARGVAYPNQVLASGSTSLVLVRGYLRPGIQAGDRFDVEIRTPGRSETKSLAGGRLLETRLSETAVAGGAIREGTLLALAEGPLLVDPSVAGDDQVAGCRARVLGGGVALKSRPLYLMLKPDYRNVAYSGAIGTAINRRFHTFESGVKQGVANPKDDKLIQLIVHPRYKDNIERYVQVLRSIPVREDEVEQKARMGLLERQLLDPVTSSTAALRLEAMGKDGVSVLKQGIAAADPEVRFYAAEALAYLDDASAASPLALAARDEPAFRAYALAALSAMDDYAAYEALVSLLSVPSAETRYGAFRALWAMNPDDALVRGEKIPRGFGYHVIDSDGPEMVHVTRSFRPEVVVFGANQQFCMPLVLEAGKHILVNGQSNNEITVTRFAPGKPEEKRVVSPKVDEVVRAIIELGGTYPDVVAALQQAKHTGALAGRLAVDAVPTGGRQYRRAIVGAEDSATMVAAADSKTDSQDSGFVVANPVPQLFAADRFAEDRSRGADADGGSELAKAAAGQAENGDAADSPVPSTADADQGSDGVLQASYEAELGEEKSAESTHSKDSDTPETQGRRGFGFRPFGRMFGGSRD